jgi:DNA polymerase-1
MFNVLRQKGLIDESKIQYTEKGNPRYGKEVIDSMVSNKQLVDVLRLRSKLQKLLTTYMRPLAKSALANNGRYFPYYNQTRSENDFGTRTGRFSSNIQQLPKTTGSNAELYGMIDERLPMVRKFITPQPGNILIDRDFSGQEYRIMAHYAEGAILKAYQRDPNLDPHAYVNDLIFEKTGHRLGRTPTKCINFLKVYGGGPQSLANILNVPLEQARSFFAAYDEAFPEPKQLIKDVEKLARSGKKIRTWGGRSYDVETVPDGRRMYYKLVNVLIQGSAADQTKEAMIRYHYHPDRHGDIFMQVHDEIVIETDTEHLESLIWLY